MCGIVGIVDKKGNIIKKMADSLHSLQHRGKESAGITFLDLNGIMRTFRIMGFANKLFQQNNLLANKTHAAIAHVRYSTTGESTLENAHPICGKYQFGDISVVHNGNITNATYLKSICNVVGAPVFQTSTDTEIILHLIAISKKETLDEALVDAVSQLEGAFSFLLLSETALYAVRDAHEFRGLAIGKTKHSYVFASETVALDVIDAKYVREVVAGEIVKINFNTEELETIALNGDDTPLSHCAFESVYLQSPASIHTDSENKEVYSVRKQFGVELGKYFCSRFSKEIRRNTFLKFPDMVMSIPDSGNPAALGFAYASGIPLEIGIIRDHYSSRTFMSPQQKTREDCVRTKFRATPMLLKGKSVVVVDDSLVRGTTLKWVVSELLKRQCQVAEVHVCIASPPIIHPCMYGIDMKSHDELIAAQKKEQEICDFICANSLTYLPLELFEKTLGGHKKPWCLACFTGDYPA